MKPPSIREIVSFASDWYLYVIAVLAVLAMPILIYLEVSAYLTPLQYAAVLAALAGLAAGAYYLPLLAVKKEQRRETDRYFKIADPENHSAFALVTDLRTRAKSYERSAERTARRKLEVDNTLAFAVGLLAAATTVALTLFQSKLLNETIAVILSILTSTSTVIVSLVRLHYFDGRVSQRAFELAHQFYEIAASLELIREAKETDEISEALLLARFERIKLKYDNLQRKFVEHVATSMSYYTVPIGQGRLRHDDPIILEAKLLRTEKRGRRPSQKRRQA